MTNFLEMARRLRLMVEQQAENFTDKEALEIPIVFPKWAPDTEYNVGDRVREGEKLYKVLQQHISQANWNPAEAPSLYAEILPGQEGSGEEIGDWVQPDSTNPYMLGDKVRHNGKIWVCMIDYNVWEPGVYGWEEAI